MVIKLPQHHNFSDSVKKEIADKTRCPLPEWEISVTRKDDLAWSIVLSYIISTNYKDSEDFTRRLKILTGSDENSQLVSKSISYFNPFRNRYSCFYDEILKTVVNTFKKHFGWTRLLSVSDKLSAASKALECPILLIKNYKQPENYQIYPTNAKKHRGLITLLAFTFTDDGDENNTETVYNFLINNKRGLKMKTAALLYYIKETTITRKEIIKLLNCEINKNDNMLIAMIKNDCTDVVLKLYDSPYVVSKLSEAGYEMDPRATDADGFSALHHALVLSNPIILYKLYYFAANDCCKSEGSYRNPDSNIVSNLLQMKELLSINLSKVEYLNDPEKYRQLKRKYDELLRLNQFLIEVNGKILKIKKQLNYYESTEENIFEAIKRRDIIVTLLDTYEEFFKGIEQDFLELSPLDDYIFCENYYSLVDMATAIIFFDNIIFLKERLALENDNQFSEIESSFFFSVIYHMCFAKIDILKTVRYPNPYISFNLKSFYIFPLMKRQDNLKEIIKFKQILHDTTINEDSVIKSIPKSEVYSIFNSYPAFKDVIEIGRMKTYINISLKAKVENIKSVLVIERVLQVIGEYIAPQENDDYSFKRFLYLCLPKEISQILRRLRHELSHLKGHAFPSKFECESNLSLFRSIKREILQLEKYYFKPVYGIMRFSLAVYLMEQLQNELERLKKSVHLYTYTHVYPFFLNDDFILSLKNTILFPFLQKFKLSCRDFLKIALRNLEDEIKNEYISSDTHSVNYIQKRIIYILWPIKWLLELCKQSKIDNVSSLLDILEGLEDCSNTTISELKESTDIFIRECYGFFQTFDIAKKKKKQKPLKSTKYIEHFMKILKGFVYLSNDEKDRIRAEIPQTIIQSVSIKEELIQSIADGFPLDIDQCWPKLELTYFSKTKMQDLKDYYKSKDSYALTILQTVDPIAELEEIFSKNCANKKKYDSLCDTMEFSEKTRKKLGKLVAGQRKKVPVNNLSNLLNRIELLKKILIKENEEIHRLWFKIKSQKSRQLIDDKIVHIYLKDRQLQAAVEMILFDCMMLFETEKLSKNPWTKTSRLYSGINLRNVISHGSPLLESLCKLLDPEDLPSEIIKKMITLIKGEHAVKSILELYELVTHDYTKLLEIINREEKDEYSCLRETIVKCNEWQNYVLLLPYKSQKLNA